MADFIDSHVHLADPAFADDADAVIATGPRSRCAGPRLYRGVACRRAPRARTGSAISVLRFSHLRRASARRGSVGDRARCRAIREARRQRRGGRRRVRPRLSLRPRTARAAAPRARRTAGLGGRTGATDRAAYPRRRGRHLRHAAGRAVRQACGACFIASPDLSGWPRRASMPVGSCRSAGSSRSARGPTRRSCGWFPTTGC